MRPAVSVVGTRCTRCTPLSRRIRLQAESPWSEKETFLKPPTAFSAASRTSRRQPWVSAKREYIRKRSPAKSPASSPPAAGRISTITSFPSLGCGGRISVLIVRSSWTTLASCSAMSASSSSRNSPSSSASSSSRLSAMAVLAFSQASQASSRRLSCWYSRLRPWYSFCLPAEKSKWAIACSTSASRLRDLPM